MSSHIIKVLRINKSFFKKKNNNTLLTAVCNSCSYNKLNDLQSSAMSDSSKSSGGFLFVPKTAFHIEKFM